MGIQILTGLDKSHSNVDCAKRYAFEFWPGLALGIRMLNGLGKFDHQVNIRFSNIDRARQNIRMLIRLGIGLSNVDQARHWIFN